MILVASASAAAAVPDDGAWPPRKRSLMILAKGFCSFLMMTAAIGLVDQPVTSAARAAGVAAAANPNHFQTDDYHCCNDPASHHW